MGRAFLSFGSGKSWLKSIPCPGAWPIQHCGWCGRQGGADWQEALEVDTSIRNRRLLGAGKPGHEVQRGITLYVHPARKPLAQAVAIPEDEGAYQVTMNIGCEGGYCMT